MGIKDITTSKLEVESFGSFLGKELPAPRGVRKARGATRLASFAFVAAID